MKARILVTVLTLIIGILTEAAEPVFQAGAARSNITPPLGQRIVGSFRPYPCTSVHDELWAKCVVLDDGQTKLAFVVCDVLGIVRPVYELAARLVEEHTGIPRSHLMMSATHTHSAGTALGETRFDLEPKLDPYQRFLAQRISEAVRIAVSRLEPARIGWGSVDKPEHVFNRRWHLKPGAMPENPFGNRNDIVKMNPGRAHANLVKPAGPIDPEVVFVSVQSKAGRPLALLANYSLHYIGGTKRGEISADYYGYFGRRMTRLLAAERQDPGFVALLSNGTSGDINNVDFTKRTPRLPSYEKMKQVANDVAESTFAALKKISYQDTAELGARFAEVPAKVRQPDSELLARSRKMQAAVKDPAKKSTAEVYADRILLLNRLPRQIPLPAQAFRIGDLGVAAIPCEVLVEIGLELKTKSPFKKSFTHSNAGGYYGYLPTAEQFRLGGYETWISTCWFEEETASKITKELLEMWDSMHR
jgi:neutral ceramidase